jgi:hypothetical protein
MYSLNLLEMALVLADTIRTYEDRRDVKFFEHFAYIAARLDGLWDEQDGFFYDRLRRTNDGSRCWPRTCCAAPPGWAAATCFAGVRPSTPRGGSGSPSLARTRHGAGSPRTGRRSCPPPPAALARYHASGNRPRAPHPSFDRRAPATPLCSRPCSTRASSCSPYGLRSALPVITASTAHVLTADGPEARLDYDPAEATTGDLQAGNSNWRSTDLVPAQLPRARVPAAPASTALGDDFGSNCPRARARRAHLGEVADELQRRLLRLFLVDSKGRSSDPR